MAAAPAPDCLHQSLISILRLLASSRATDESASRAADEISVDDLRIKVASADDDGASFSQTWNSLAEFPLDQKFKVGTYKGAVEPFMLDKLSDANREQIQSYISTIGTM